MSRWNGFGRSLAFAAIAAAALLVLEPLLASVVGARDALRLLAVGSAAVYVAGLAPSWRRGVAASLCASALGAALLVSSEGASRAFMLTAIGAGVMGLLASFYCYRVIVATWDRFAEVLSTHRSVVAGEVHSA